MKTVSAFEAKLIRCTRAVATRAEPEQAVHFAKSVLTPPACLRADAVRLVEDAIARGITRTLAREGWRAERYLRGQQPRVGRLWQRTEPADLGLTFSANALALLQWLAAGDARLAVPKRTGAFTTGDALLGWLVYQFFRRTELAARLCDIPLIVESVPCRLFYPEDFADDPEDAHVWTQGTPAAIVEALQHLLAERWLELEMSKRTVAEPAAMRTIGARQERTLVGWLDACASSQRWDLARFLLPLAGKLWGDVTITTRRWIGGLTVAKLNLAERTNLYRTALVVPSVWLRLADWTRQARATGYLDDGYAAAQLWKADWETYHGDELAQRAHELLSEVEPLRTGRAP